MKKETIALSLFIILLGMLVVSFFIPEKKAKIEPVITIKEVVDTIYPKQFKDSVELLKLIPMLKEREGLRLKPYRGIGKDYYHWYIGYGHQILRWENLTKITIEDAEKMLWDDIKKSAVEARRIREDSFLQDTYSVFVSGNIYN